MDGLGHPAPILEHAAPAGADPLDDDAFVRRMARLGPFESAPVLAVALSGGGDSLALLHLADGWARAHGGRVVGLTVDHGLRPEAAAEAALVASWLAAAGIEHRTLRWDGAKPDTGLQAAARAARYRLLEEACRRDGILHLLLGHQADDQAETHLLRRDAGSGADGLAAMAPVSERPGVRLLRPLLDVPGARLRATLQARGMAWIEDPSNRDRAFARVRLRQDRAGDADLDGTVDGLGRMRVAAEGARWRLLARTAVLHPAGFACLDGRRLAAAEPGIAEAALGRLAACLGGRPHLPRRDRVARLLAWIAEAPDSAAGTLGGCRLLPHGDRLLLCREARGLPAPMAVTAGDRLLWDGRFAIRLEGRGAARLAPLGADGWRQVRQEAAATVAHPVRLSLPALWDDAGVFAVPHLGYNRSGAGNGRPEARIAWHPRENLSGVGFCVA